VPKQPFEVPMFPHRSTVFSTLNANAVTVDPKVKGFVKITGHAPLAT